MSTAHYSSSRRVLTALLGIIFAVASGILPTSHTHALNAWDRLRWPWQYNQSWQLTQQWNGGTSHFNSIFYAVDAALDQSYRPLYAPAEGMTTCSWINTFGNTTRVVYTLDSITTSHMYSCWFDPSNPTWVTQGSAIGYSGATDANAIHVHLQVNNPSGSMSSKAFNISGYTPTDNGGADCPCPWKTSDNLGAGYDTGYNYYYAIHDKLASVGWASAGSTVALPYYQSPCFVSTPAVSGCSSNGYSGIVQTFRGASSVPGGGEHGILQRSGGSAVFMSRGFYYPYVLYWDGSAHQGMWYLGYPTTDSYYWYGVYRMDFQNGYATYNVYNCQSLWYQGGYLIKNYTYCD